MKKRKEREEKQPLRKSASVYIPGSGEVRNEIITETLEVNFMPYAMSVIVSRAIPEIDGFKPSHRKLLYTMYKMGLLGGSLTKSANVVGQTMRLNPHGEGAIYETMVRMTRGNEALLVPYVESKGNFGKAYSRDMAYAASRYTEVKLTEVCKELFADIDSDTVEFVDNYDSTTTEPSLLPVRFPSILVNSNTGIAVGMASNICPFNLKEVCETAIALLKNPDHDVIQTLTAPDFPGGGLLIYDRAALEEIYNTGRGSVKVRSVYTTDNKENRIEITQIPPTTTVEAIIDKIVELVKAGKIKEISDIRDETDLNGLRIAIDLKRGTDPDSLMAKLFKSTTLEDSFSANFNILIGATPMVMGVKEILSEWTAFRVECVKRRIFFDLKKRKDLLHLLRGLELILLDIDRAIATVRNTREEAMVIPNLMAEFGIDKIQAEYVAEIKLRNLNREYILKRLADIEKLEAEIAELELDFKSKQRQYGIIIRELEEISKKYGSPRKTAILEQEEAFAADAAEPEMPDYPVTVYFTREGYMKKLTAMAVKNAGEHKLKDGDAIISTFETTNNSEILVLSDRQNAYKARLYEFEDGKSSTMGDYLPAKLGFEDGEGIVFFTCVTEYTGSLLIFFENGKAAKVSLGSYATKQNRRKLIGGYSGTSKTVGFWQLKENEPQNFAVYTNDARCLVFDSDLLETKASRDTIGVTVINLKSGRKVKKAVMIQRMTKNMEVYKVFSLPRAGTPIKTEQLGLT